MNKMPVGTILAGDTSHSRNVRDRYIDDEDESFGFR